MKKRWMGFILLLFIILLIGAVWKWYVNDSKDGTVVPGTSQPAQQESAPTTLPGPGEILARSRQVPNLYCEYAIKPDDSEALKGRMWIQDYNLRSEMLDSHGKATTVLIRSSASGAGYMFSPGQKEAVKATELQPQDEINPIRSAAALGNKNLTVIGRDNMGGKSCLVVQYQQDEAAIRVWVWEEKGLPIREENTYDKHTTVVEYTNFRFDAITDDLFQLPAGVKVVNYSGGGGMP